MPIGKWSRWLPLIVILVSACHPVRGCREGQFELADASRVPQWFQADVGQNRSQFTVSLSYWIGSGGRWASFTLRGPDGKVVRTETGKLRGEGPFTFPPRVPGTELRFPCFEAATVGDVTEIIEYRDNRGLFYLNDDSRTREAIERQAGAEAVP